MLLLAVDWVQLLHSEEVPIPARLDKPDAFALELVQNPLDEPFLGQSEPGVEGALLLLFDAAPPEVADAVHDDPELLLALYCLGLVLDEAGHVGDGLIDQVPLAVVEHAVEGSDGADRVEHHLFLLVLFPEVQSLRLLRHCRLVIRGDQLRLRVGLDDVLPDQCLVLLGLVLGEESELQLEALLDEFLEVGCAFVDSVFHLDGSFDPFLNGRNLVVVAERPVEDSLVEVPLGGTVGVFLLQLFYLLLSALPVDHHLLHHLSHHSPLLFRRHLQRVEGVVPHVFHRRHLHQVQLLRVQGPVGNEDHHPRHHSLLAVAGDVPGNRVLPQSDQGVHERRVELPLLQVGLQGGHHALRLAHEAERGGLLLRDEPQELERPLLVSLHVGLDFCGDGDQVGAVLVGVDHVFHGRPCLIPLHDVGDFGPDLLLLGEVLVEGLVDVVLLERLQPLAASHFEALDFYLDARGYFHEAFEEGDWVGLPFPELFVQFLGQGGREYLHVVLELQLELHEKLAVGFLRLMHGLSLDEVLRYVVGDHEVDGDDVQLYVLPHQLVPQDRQPLPVVPSLPHPASPQEPSPPHALLRVVDELVHHVLDSVENVPPRLGVPQLGLAQLQDLPDDLDGRLADGLEEEVVPSLLVGFLVSEQGKADVVALGVEDLVLEGVLDVSEGHFESGVTFGAHLIHSGACIHHEHDSFFGHEEKLFDVVLVVGVGGV